MKKIFLFAAIAVVLILSSCSTPSVENIESTDSTTIDSIEVDTVATDTICGDTL